VRFAKGSKYIRDVTVSPSGSRVAAEFRGEIVTVPAEKGDPRILTNSPGVHERNPAWSPDGKTIAYFSDEGGEYQLVLAPQNGKGEPRKLRLSGAAREWQFTTPAGATVSVDRAAASTPGTGSSTPLGMVVVTGGVLAVHADRAEYLNTPPFILVQPQDRSALPGEIVVFKVVANGSVPLSYQWFFGPDPLPGETGPTLTVSFDFPDQGGDYRVVVSNDAGSVTSDAATLSGPNQPPSFTKGPDQSIPEDAGPQSIAEVCTTSGARKRRRRTDGDAMAGSGSADGAGGILRPQPPADVAQDQDRRGHVLGDDLRRAGQSVLNGNRQIHMTVNRKLDSNRSLVFFVRDLSDLSREAAVLRPRKPRQPHSRRLTRPEPPGSRSRKPRHGVRRFIGDDDRQHLSRGDRRTAGQLVNVTEPPRGGRPDPAQFDEMFQFAHPGLLLCDLDERVVAATREARQVGQAIAAADVLIGFQALEARLVSVDLEAADVGIVALPLVFLLRNGLAGQELARPLGLLLEVRGVRSGLLDMFLLLDLGALGRLAIGALPFALGFDFTLEALRQGRESRQSHAAGFQRQLRLAIVQLHQQFAGGDVEPQAGPILDDLAFDLRNDGTRQGRDLQSGRPGHFVDRHRHTQEPEAPCGQNHHRGESRDPPTGRRPAPKRLQSP
jgi:hypothetical protein